MNIRISAIICTLNRVEYLRKAIKSLADQTLPKEHYEIMVVDNGSTDGTKRVVLEEFSAVHNLRYLHEPVLGLSQARNTGWQNARGKYVAYLDDDAVASSNWLEKILGVFDTAELKIGCVGGRVVPIWKTPRTPWLPSELLSYFSVMNPSNNPTILEPNKQIAGANIAFPRDVLEAAGGFRTDLGRKGNKLLSNEEVMLRRQIEDKGYSSFYHPEIVVWHHVPANRVTKGYLLRRLYWQGVSEAVMQIHQKPLSMTTRLRVGFSESFSIVMLSPIEFFSLLIPTNNPERFKNKCFTLARIGYVLAMWGIVK